MFELNTPYFSHSSQCHKSDSFQHSYIPVQNTRRPLQFKSMFFFKPKTSRCVLPYQKWVCTTRRHKCLLTLLLVIINAMETGFDPYLFHLQASIHVRLKFHEKLYYILSMQWKSM